MRLKAVGVGLVLALSSVACTGRQDPVPLVGTAADIESLVGEWVGEYSSRETGRSGRITFTLAAQGDTARGDVVMIPEGTNLPLRPEPNAPSGAETRRAPEVLTISFVRVSGGRVSGSLAPYRDPDCGCPLHTTFEGRLSGDTIEGTFQTRHGQTNEVFHGRWKVLRAPRRS